MTSVLKATQCEKNQIVRLFVTQSPITANPSYTQPPTHHPPMADGAAIVLTYSRY